MKSKKHPYFIALLLSVASIFIHCASFAEFENTYGGSGDDTARCTIRTTDGGYALLGSTSSYGTGLDDMYLIKTDVDGVQVWHNTFGGLNIDRGYAVVQDADGGYTLFGDTYSFGSGDCDMYLVKTDSNGNELWKQTYGGSSADHGRSVQHTSDGGYILFGHTSSFTASSLMYLVKTDSSGNVQWERTFGGLGDEYGKKVLIASDGGYVLLGDTNSFGLGYQIYLVKTDSDGNEVWKQTFGGLGDEYSGSFWYTSDGGYILTGQTGSGTAGGTDVYLVKTDSNGAQQWYSNFGDASDDVGNDVRQTPDGEYVVVGRTGNPLAPVTTGGDVSVTAAGGSDLFVLRADAAGNELWNAVFGGTGDDEGFSALYTSSGGYILSGNTSSAGAGGDDVYFISAGAYYYKDADGDTFGDPNDYMSHISQPTGYVTDNSDCDDTDALINPNGIEIPGDGIDQDCNGSDLITFYRDLDGDGYGDPDNFVTVTSQPGAGYVTNSGDCNDNDPAVNPDAEEVANDGIDQDCDGSDLVLTDDFGDDAATSLPVTVETIINGEIEVTGDVDWLNFQADAGTEYTIETTLGATNAPAALLFIATTDTHIYLYDTDGATMIIDDDDSGEGYASKIVWSCVTAGTYYVKVTGYTGTYSVLISAAVPIDTSNGGDTGDSGGGDTGDSGGGDTGTDGGTTDDTTSGGGTDTDPAGDDNVTPDDTTDSGSDTGDAGGATAADGGSAPGGQSIYECFIAEASYNKTNNSAILQILFDFTNSIHSR